MNFFLSKYNRTTPSLFRKNFFKTKFHHPKYFSYSKAKPDTASLSTILQTPLKALNLEYLSSNLNDKCFHNLSYGELFDKEAQNQEGIFTRHGAFAVDTGIFTGRSPKDKYVVKQQPSQEKIWWGEINTEMDPKVFDELHKASIDHFRNVNEIYVCDLFCGAHKESRKKVRFIMEKAWHCHFVSNMFIKPSPQELENFEPDFTVINCWHLKDKEWEKHGLNSQNYACFNLEKKTALIGGLWYGGEMKKGIFSMMHYWLPSKHILSMHCSANIGVENNDTCLFFGLSGTGKTTLSTDKYRRLIGDDEHGWDEEGIFNFEGGCYAKTSKLSLETEPEIYRAVKSGALLENVWVDPKTREIDYFNESMTENGRVSYPIEHIDNRESSLAGDHPKYIIFLCCDAFGVMPPVSKLNPGQSMYHFISGYTAKVAGTERGIKEPVASFSPCYGAAFLTLHPMEYAALFKEKLEQHKVDVYLINTGWTKGPYGVGERMSIKTTRSCLNNIFNGKIKEAKFRKDEVFGFEVPLKLDGIDDETLNPRLTWKNKDEYDENYLKLAKLFSDNIDKYADPNLYKDFGPTIHQFK